MSDVNTLAEMDAALTDDLNVDATNSIFPEATRIRALNRAYRKAAALFNWPQLMDAKKTTTQLNQDYYDVPTGWRPFSMWKLKINDETYGEDPDGSPIKFADFLIFKEDLPNDTTRKWALQEKRFFVTPTPTTAGLQICAWGQKNVTALAEDGDTTVFSYNAVGCNEAIILEASAILKKKGEQDEKGQMLSKEAGAMLAVEFGRFGGQRANSEKIQPFFHVQDMFATRGKGARVTDIGNFQNG